MPKAPNLKLAEAMFAYDYARVVFEDALYDLGFRCESIGGDQYDNSIELYQVPPDQRMNEPQQKLIYDEGFARAFVNHTDKWETHYTWDRSKEFRVSRGWRRKHKEGGGFLISYWPESWSKLEWLKTGHVEVVPDPLEGAVTEVGKWPETT